MTPEKNNQTLTRWLLIATIALLVLVLGLQLWQLFGKAVSGNSDNAPPLTADASTPENPQAAGSALSPGKSAMIEDVRALNEALSANELAKLSTEELEQLWETGAPGLPVGMSFAAQAAEEYAGTLAVDSVTSETDPELDEAPPHYEVELHHPTLGDFSYKIDAYTGEVLEGAPNILQNLHVTDASPEDPEAPGGQSVPAGNQPSTAEPQPPAASAQKPVSNTPVQQPAATDEEAAKNAAFTHAGVTAAQVSGLRCKLEWDDGRQVYDIDFWVGDTEYDYEIEASTGVVLEAQQERGIRPSGASAQQPGSFIGEEAAKNAAFAHAGISATDAGSIQCELDEDDGHWVYEVEFRTGGVEYDYEIDASTGTVVKAEQDR